MRIRMQIFLVLFAILSTTPQMLYAQEAVSNSDLLIRIEEGQKRLETRIDNLDARINDLRRDMDSRFDDLRTDMNSRFDDFKFWLQIIVTGIATIIGGIVAQWLIVWKKITHVEGQVEDRLILGYREQEFNEMKKRLVSLEAKIAALT